MEICENYFNIHLIYLRLLCIPACPGSTTVFDELSASGGGCYTFKSMVLATPQLTGLSWVSFLVSRAVILH